MTRGNAPTHRSTLALVLTLLAAGCVSEGGAHGGHGDEGDEPRMISPGANETLAFDAPGAYRIHCHPHPFMEQTITVTDSPPEEVHVHIHDGERRSDYRYEPATLSVGAGSRVTYHNHGALEHTATLEDEPTG